MILSQKYEVSGKKTRYGGLPSVWGWGVGTVKKFLAEYLLCGACIQLKKTVKAQIIGILEYIDSPY